MAVKKPVAPVDDDQDDDSDDIPADAPEWAKKLFTRLVDKVTEKDDDRNTSKEGPPAEERDTGERKPKSKHWLFGE